MIGKAKYRLLLPRGLDLAIQAEQGGLRIVSACDTICLDVPYARENARNECAYSYCVDIPAAHNPGRMWKV